MATFSFSSYTGESRDVSAPDALGLIYSMFEHGISLFKIFTKELTLNYFTIELKHCLWMASPSLVCEEFNSLSKLSQGGVAGGGLFGFVPRL